MKLAPDVIFYCNMIIIASEKASNKQEILSMVNKELKNWKIPVSTAVECIDEYVEHLSEIMKEHDSFSKKTLPTRFISGTRLKNQFFLR